jgi:hypothetical protein
MVYAGARLVLALHVALSDGPQAQVCLVGRLQADGADDVSVPEAFGSALDDELQGADLDVAAGQLQAQSVDQGTCWLVGGAVADRDVRHPVICCLGRRAGRSRSWWRLLLPGEQASGRVPV